VIRGCDEAIWRRYPPLNALMLANIASAATGHMDFIQGPMGSWNFACFGATAGVLFISIRDKEVEMRQTATGALAARGDP